MTQKIGGADPDLRETLRFISLSWRTIVLSTVLGITVSIMTALMLTKTYTAVAIVGPNVAAETPISGVMGQYAGIANLAGISLPSGADTGRSAVALQLMKSANFVGDFAYDRNILPDLFAIDSWDEVSRTIAYDHNIYDGERKVWTREVSAPLSAKPSRLEAFELFAASLEIEKDPQTGFVSLRISSRSPEVSAKWLRWLIQDVNDYLRDDDIEEARRAIQFLNHQLSETSVSELRMMLFDLIQRQTEAMMIAEVTDEYALKVIDGPVEPYRHTFPKRALIVALGGLLSSLVGVVIVLIRKL